MIEEGIEYVLGVSSTPVTAYLWKIDRPENQSMKITLCSRIPLPIHESQSIIEANPSIFFERKQHMKTNLGPWLFSTLDSNNCIQFWQYGWKGSLNEASHGSIPWTPISSMQFDESLKKVSFGKLGYLATVTQKADSLDELALWNPLDRNPMKKLWSLEL
jgi:hypothetical protein